MQLTKINLQNLPTTYVAQQQQQQKKQPTRGLPGGSVVKNPPVNAGDMGLIPDSGRSHMLQATKPTYHNSRACTLETGSRNCEPMCPSY